jgi:cell division protease FtsH
VVLIASLSADVKVFASDWLPVATIVFMLSMIVLLALVMRSLPRTKPQEIKPDSASSVGWEDIAGVEDARQELAEVVEFLRDPGRFAALGARVPRGVLLHGPPGTGKTLLAKAVAHESGARFYAQSAAGFVEMFAGLGAARVRRLFRIARKNEPSIIFIDELDAVGGQRGMSLNGEKDQTLNQLLIEMDGFKSSDRLVVIAASNLLDSLDSALLRPGRFDRQIYVAPPDVRAREDILRVHVRNKPIAEVDLELVARQTSGLTGADLANICNEAAIFAARESVQHIRTLDFDNALERVIAGLQSRRAVTDKEKRILAYHEAGHALMSHLMGETLPVHKVTIIARGDALGYAYYLPEEERYLHTKEELVDIMKVGLAGRAAEEIVFGRVTNGAASDLEKVTMIARAMVFDYGMSDLASSRTMRADNYALSEETKRMRDSEQARLTDHAYAEAERLLRKHRRPLDRVAASLLEFETLDRDELEKMLHDVEPESQASATVGTVRALARAAE